MQSSKQIWIIAVFLALFLVLLTVGIRMALGSIALGYDYMFYWQGGRAVFAEGISPYSLEVTQRLQMVFMERLALPGEYQHPFSYPLSILFIPLPLYFLSYDWSQSAWMALNLLTPFSVGLLLFQRAPKWLVLTLPLFYQMTFTWIIGNYALLITVILLAVFYMLFVMERAPGWAEILCGVLLAWTTNKPQMVWLFVSLALIFALRQHRWIFIKGFAGGLAGLHLLSLALQPDWIGQWLSIVPDYPVQNVDIPSLVMFLDYLLPTATARTASAILALPLALATVLLFRRWWYGRLPALLLLGWCALLTSLVDLSFKTPDQNVMLVPVFLWAIHQRPTAWLKAGWFGAIALTWGFFFLSLFQIIPDIVDRGPLLVYLLWLAGVWWFGRAHLASPATGAEAEGAPAVSPPVQPA